MARTTDIMLVSIVIPAFNEENYLPQTLALINFALQDNMAKGFLWEIIVCDNNSTDRTAEIAINQGAKVIFEPINQIAKARNRGAEIARGDWLLFSDADSYPPPALINAITEIIADGNYIGCGTTVLVEGGTLFNKLRMERLNPLFRFFNWSGGALLLCESAAFRAFGGFSTALYAYEEVDFVQRLKRFGRTKGQKFTVIHRHPVVTSGRKGEYNFISMIVLFISNLLAVVLFFLHYILPQGMTAWLGSWLLGYWYAQRR